MREGDGVLPKIKSLKHPGMSLELGLPHWYLCFYFLKNKARKQKNIFLVPLKK